jgi:CDP-diacylglycerol--glycerol-3-phosphate 3-phosphatidyltransferase
MNLANKITIARLLLIPVLIALIVSYRPEHQWIRHTAYILFALMAISDYIDGYIARNYNQQTRLGTILDPCADKILINTTYIFLAVNHHLETPVPGWIPVVIMLRDVGILGTSLLLNEFRGPIRPIPRILGKLTTWAYAFGVMGVLLQVSFAHELLILVVVISMVSAADYAFFGHEKVIDHHPHVEPNTPREQH